VRVYDQAREPPADRGLAQIALTEAREFQVDQVEPLGAQNPVQGRLYRWHRGEPPLEAPGRGQGLELKQTPGQSFPNVRFGDQHNLAAVSLHGMAAVLCIEELVVDQHHRGEVMAPRQLGH
jgi:hypothetical protein